MRNYKRRPQVVQAVQIDDANLQELLSLQWERPDSIRVRSDPCGTHSRKHVRVRLFGGSMDDSDHIRGGTGDWVLKVSTGDYRVVSNARFRREYEELA